jgi:hypothetical protein
MELPWLYSFTAGIHLAACYYQEFFMNRRPFSLMGLGAAAAALLGSSSGQTGEIASPSNLEQAGIAEFRAWSSTLYRTPAASRPTLRPGESGTFSRCNRELGVGRHIVTAIITE